MDTRETLPFATKSGKNKAVLHTYLTRREQRDITNAMFGDTAIKVKTGGSKENDTELNMANMSVSEDLAIGYAIVELNGSTENIVDRFLDLPDVEASEIKAKIDELTKGPEDEKKAVGAKSTQDS